MLLTTFNLELFHRAHITALPSQELSCGLPDTFAYYTAQELEAGFKKTCAFQPRVIKQNRGSAGEGIWLAWLQGKEYCKAFGERSVE